jgi:uncharacterized protein
MFSRRRILFASAALLMLCAFGIVLWSGHQLASPARRVLQDYHREFLADPSAHGVILKSFTLKDGTPCLMMEPLANGRVGIRGEKVRAQLTTENVPFPAPGSIHATLVLVHGRKGRKEDYLLIGERLCAVGFRCLLPDMPAHGDHPVSTITFGLRESGIPENTLHEAAQRFGFSPMPSGLLGMSMGGAVAIHAAARDSAPWKTVVIISSFDRLETAVHQTLATRIGGPLASLLQHSAGWVYQCKTGLPLADIRSDLPASRLKMPVLMAHGTEDRVIPFSSGQKLFSSIPDTVTKQWIDVPDADHENVLITDFPIYAAITCWMLEKVK